MLALVAMLVVGILAIVALFAIEAWRQRKFDRLPTYEHARDLWEIAPGDDLPLWANRNPAPRPYDWAKERTDA